MRLGLRHKRLRDLRAKRVPAGGPKGGAKEARVDFGELLLKLKVLEEGEHRVICFFPKLKKSLCPAQVPIPLKRFDRDGRPHPEG